MKMAVNNGGLLPIHVTVHHGQNEPVIYQFKEDYDEVIQIKTN